MASKFIPPLSVKEVGALPIGTHNVGGVPGLYLRKLPNKSFYYFRYTENGKRRDLYLGTYSKLTLAQARLKATAAKSMVEQGISPVEAAKTARICKATQRQQRVPAHAVISFEKVAREWISERVKAGYWAENQRGESNTIRLLELYAFPLIGSKAIGKITPEHIRDCLAPIWQTKPSSAKKLKTHLTKIFQWALAMKKLNNSSNPADWNGPLGILMEAYQSGRKPKEHMAATAITEIPRLFVDLSAFTSASANAIRFAILTATRSKAVRLATWDEINFEDRVWTIPIDHDKIKTPYRDRRIFLSEEAICLLNNIPRFTDSPFIFASCQGKALSDAAFSVFFHGLHTKRFNQDGIGWIDPVKSQLLGKPALITIHGTARASFRTWAREDSLGNNRRFDQDAVELCLLHERDDILRGAYDRSKLEIERRRIMEEWGKYCMSKLSK